MALQYAEGGSFNNWMEISEDWNDDMITLKDIIQGLKKIHEKNMKETDKIKIFNKIIIPPFNHSLFVFHF